MSWEKTLEKKLRTGILPLQRSREKNHFNVLYFDGATQNKALDMMKLVSKISFLSENLLCQFRKNR